MILLPILLVLGVVFGILLFVVGGSSGTRGAAATGCVVAAVSALLLAAGFIALSITLSGV